MRTALACVMLTILLFGCTSQQPPAQPPGQPSGGNQTPPTSANEVTVQISGFRFDPADIEVSVGTKVIWVNNDPAMHTVTFDNGVFDTGQFPHGDSRSYIFNKTENYTYHCAVHPSMKGSVAVK